ncbi:Imm39 family immunity protein [Candidatus Odyssella thessalonicensis]|uniref:Imm39 family immunity protein n=1 Tax=Candidatus Odyssella thessalonicensis TaxID=84647 RepID=UPI000225B78C|nr:Imm39 family immunity protein [Candidatus Odyssella thessalonicensis]
MDNNRRLSFSAVALVAGRLRNSYSALLSVRNKIEPILIKDWFNINPLPPFKWVGLMFQYGIKNSIIPPKYGKIHPKYGDLPLKIELDMSILEWADRHDVKLLEEIFEISALEALIHVGKKYKLDTNNLYDQRLLLGSIPEIREEM